MQYFGQILALAAVANAAIYQREAAIEVTLSEADHAVVKATVKNTGTAPLNLFKYGTFFDAAPVEKFDVHAVKSKVPFEGMRRRVQTTNLKEDVFHLLQPGAIFETEVMQPPSIRWRLESTLSLLRGLFPMPSLAPPSSLARPFTTSPTPSPSLSMVSAQDRLRRPFPVSMSALQSNPTALLPRHPLPTALCQSKYCLFESDLLHQLDCSRSG
jgi:hypothetical protein